MASQPEDGFGAEEPPDQEDSVGAEEAAEPEPYRGVRSYHHPDAVEVLVCGPLRLRFRHGGEWPDAASWHSDDAE